MTATGRSSTGWSEQASGVNTGNGAAQPRRPQEVVKRADARFFALLAPRAFDSVVPVRLRGPEGGSSPALGVVIFFALVAAELVAPNGPRWPQLGWLILLAGEVVALLTLPAALWARLCQASATADTLLSENDNEALARWMNERMRPPFHLVFCLAGAALAVTGTALADSHVSHHFSVATYAALGIMGFLGFDVIRWVLRAPAVLRHLRELAKTRDLRINVLAPTRTPAIRDINELLNQASMRTALGLALLATPVVWTVFDSSRSKDRLALALISLGPMLVSLATALYVTFVPQTWLSEILSIHQLRELDRLAADEIVDVSPTALVAKVDSSVSLFQTIAAAPTRIPSLERSARNAAKVLLAILPYAVTVILKLIQHARL